MGHGLVVNKSLGLQYEPVAIDMGSSGGEHLNADPRERAALREFKLGEVFLPKFPFAGVAGPERESESQGFVFFRRLNSEDLAVLAGPELIRLHAEGTKLRMTVLTSDRCR